MAVDLSLITNYLPILIFLLVFVVIFAILAKTGILGESKFVNLLVSFIIATIFVTMTNARDYVINITPWFVIFIIILMFIFAIIGFHGKIPEGFTNGIGIVFVILFLIIFFVSAFYTFSSEKLISSFGNWITQARIYGAIILIVVGAIVSWILTRK